MGSAAAVEHVKKMETKQNRVDIENRPNLAEPDGGGNARLNENEVFCEQNGTTIQASVAALEAKLFTSNRAGKFERISN